MRKYILPVLLSVSLIFGLPACKPDSEPDKSEQEKPAPNPEPTPEPEPTPTPDPEPDPDPKPEPPAPADGMTNEDFTSGDKVSW